MQVRLKLFGALRDYLPTGSSFNSCSLSIEPEETLEQLLGQLPIPADKPYLIIVNDVKIDSALFASTVLRENDEVILLPPVKGG